MEIFLLWFVAVEFTTKNTEREKNTRAGSTNNALYELVMQFCTVKHMKYYKWSKIIIML